MKIIRLVEKSKHEGSPLQLGRKQIGRKPMPLHKFIRITIPRNVK